mgnify:FL=1
MSVRDEFCATDETIHETLEGADLGEKVVNTRSRSQSLQFG